MTKRLYFAVWLTVFLTVGYSSSSYAAAEHCKGERTQACSQEVAAAGQHAHTGHAGMHQGHEASDVKLDWAGMQRHMVPMTKTITGITQRLGEIMASGDAGKKMADIAKIRDAVSTHVLRMADVMNNGGASESEMHSIHMGIDETAKMLEKVQ